jgi:hypothetical protein
MPLALGPRGEEWIIPVIRRPAFVERYGVASTRLPCDLGWDAEGKFVETVDARYRDVWEATAAIADLFFDADGAMREGGLQIGTEEALRFALRALGLNYRLGKHEQTRLRLVNDRNLWVLLGLTVDFLLVKELTGATREKKSRPAPEPVNMSPGPAGGSTPTDPAAESSG